MKEKTVKIDDITIKYLKAGKSVRIFINFGRYKKGKRTDTYTIYDAILKKHKTCDDIWLDVQNKQAVGLQVSLMKK